ncbi:MAG: carbamoyltransferase HypF [Nitrospirae bacterium]|nr:carbamoyltransferase HypF [Nitrospirota bacterium]
MERVKILVKGIVQGVGFRPFVYNLANSLNLKGFVVNSSSGVTIDIEGENISDFIDKLARKAPPLSQIMSIDIVPMLYQGYQRFRILESKEEGSFTLVSPDVSICNDCLREILDKSDRRYLYPFTNCTNCGPRYTITRSIPYDRPNTTMSIFIMCPECKEEYHNPDNRRFHAQPNACATCGPQITLVISHQSSVISQNPIKKTIELLKAGAIVAIKGLGGFHIACDATNEEAVNRLRLRKRKSNKPFALMAPDIETIREFCEVSKEEKELLTSNKRPIVLLRKCHPSPVTRHCLPDAIAPNNKYLGFMLPYTPLHYLLFFYPITPHSSLFTSHFSALVMTSGNLAEEPVVIDNDEAISRLSAIVDAFLLHNRDIFMRVDDSVIIVNSHQSSVKTSDQCPMTNAQSDNSSLVTCHPSLSFIRRSRGYVPDPIALHEDGPEVLGCGADIKNTFTITKGRYAIPSQHIGDMENYETLKFFEESLENLKGVYRVKIEAIAYDLHPGYLSTQWALSQSQKSEVRSENLNTEFQSQISNPKSQIPCYGVQHHHAHIASVMAEKGLKDKVIGVAFDGTGYGTDGNLWGGEFLLSDVTGFTRAGHLKYVPLPGGEMAIKEPWRTAISYLKDAVGDEILSYLEFVRFIQRYGIEKVNDIIKISENSIFSPLSSGAGRLFDAVSAIVGICDRNTFEGEAAIALEAMTNPDIDEDYPVDIKFRETMEVDFSTTIIRIVDDLNRDIEKEIIASRFHNTVITAIFRVVQKLFSLYMINDVVLSGGVFQNLYLLERTVSKLESAGLRVHINEKVPCNDAGISLGQAYIIRERIKATNKKP